MISPKTAEEVQVMREGGAKLGAILPELLAMAMPGVSLLEIDRHADALIRQAGGEASFKAIKGYRWATCLCVNDVVVHGIPTEYKLKDGDILTIDVGMLYKGFHTDTAWTKIAQSANPPAGRAGRKVQSEMQKFLKAGEDALWQAIAQASVGNRIGHISQAIQTIIEGAGYGIVKTLVGHGVGRQLHEAPQVPGFLKGPIETTPELEVGQTLAIEVIYAEGLGSVVYPNDDRWSIASRDGSPTAVFEHTIAVTDGEPQILTKTD